MVLLDYQLGEMKGADGSVLRSEVEKKSSELALCISTTIRSTKMYKQVIEKLPSKRVFIYFQYIIKSEILPFVRQGCLIQWYKRNGKSIPIGERTVKVPKTGIFILLKECWNLENIPITLVNPLLHSIKDKILLKMWIKSYAKRTVRWANKSSKRYTKRGYHSSPYGESGTIACHYTEGINLSQRNDIHWLSGCNIAPEQVLVYIDRNNVDNSIGRKVEAETVKQIKKQGFKCVVLKKGAVKGGDAPYWQPPKMPSTLFIGKKAAQNKAENWIIGIANNLLEEAYYWRSFYDDFNVGINYTVEEGGLKNIVRAIAFDIDKEKAGFLICKQRSEIFVPCSQSIGHYPSHVYFVWNKRIKYYFKPNYDQNDILVIAGYPNDIVKKYRYIAKLNFPSKIRTKGGRFILAIFDNMFGPDMHFSKSKMAKFYKVFLQWVIEDSTFGLIIKSKKPLVIKNLPEIHYLLNKAIKTGRCIRLENEFGRFPSEAASGAEMAVGCGISSALIESIIGGCKGIHYDMTHLKSHEFYKWGHKKIIFDDLDRMVEALKRYKENPENEPGLGDWSPYIDEIDPFRDGRGGERMGTYMRWLLESFDKGKSRDEAIQYANTLYANQWGEDKVIDMTN